MVFERLDIVSEILSELDIIFQENLLDLPEVLDLIDIIESVDYGFDSKLGSKTHRDETLELMPDCKYTKFVLKHKDKNFWSEASVQELLQGVFPKNFEKGIGFTPKTAASILGVSPEMFLAHRPGIERPQVGFLICNC